MLIWIFCVRNSGDAILVSGAEWGVDFVCGWYIVGVAVVGENPLVFCGCRLWVFFVVTRCFNGRKFQCVITYMCMSVLSALVISFGIFRINFRWIVKPRNFLCFRFPFTYRRLFSLVDDCHRVLFP